MKNWGLKIVLVVAVLPVSLFAAIDYRNYITIVGSSTAYPIVSTVAERFGKKANALSPVVISMGTGGGFKLFCSDASQQAPDITMASRQMKQSEVNQCNSNGVIDIIELKIGYDGIVFASSRDSAQFDFREKDLYLALANEVPDPEGASELVPNPYRYWSEINPVLPGTPIRVYGPPPTSGTRDMLVERLFDRSCQQYYFLRKLHRENPEAYRKHCHTLREDGAYINAGESDVRVVRKLINDTSAIGVLGYNYLERNREGLKAATINKISPEFEVIEAYEYPLSRPLYLYVNASKSRVIDDMNNFLLEFTSDSSWGADGYLVDKGLIPLAVDEQRQSRCKLAPLVSQFASQCK